MRRIVVLGVGAALLLSGSVVFAVDRLVPSVYPTIQAAIDAAVDGDTVVVEPNTYNENIDFGDKSITLTSTNPNDPNVAAATVIDASGSGTVVTFPDIVSANCVLTGFRITGGRSSDDGGGILCSAGTITINNCIIAGNTAASDGGGIYNYEADLTLLGCTFSGNEAYTGCVSTFFCGGGGIFTYYGSLMATDCTFNENVATWSEGGGIRSIEGELTLTDCTFNSNSAGGEGGGVATDYRSVVLTNCTFTGNSAWFGGAMNNSHWGATVTNCIFSGNSADQGGAIRTFNLHLGDLTLSNCTLSANVAEDYGGAVHNRIDGNVILTNCVLWGNSANEGPQIAVEQTGSVSINYSCVQGGQSDVYAPLAVVDWLDGNIEDDPCFVDADGSDNVVGTTMVILQSGRPWTSTVASASQMTHARPIAGCRTRLFTSKWSTWVRTNIDTTAIRAGTRPNVQVSPRAMQHATAL
ncbi:MAG: right-handed parallel beta-helix repeat-containing protein [Planctomycetota bacterium]|jgi:predicted outer membrane repeat protein